MNKAEEFIIQKINSLYKEYKLYAEHFDKERQSVEDKKKEIAKAIEAGSSFEDYQKEMEFLTFGYQTKVQDVNLIVSNLVNTYLIAESLKLTDNLDEAKKEHIDKLKNNRKKLTFIPTEKGLNERVSGTQQENIDNIKNSPQYKQIMEMLKQTLN